MIQFTNTLSRKKEAFKPIKKGLVGLYACGPTVYNFVHIGNLRTYLFEDILRRTLEYAGYTVRHVMNITDVDDKIIQKSKDKRQKIEEFTRSYEKAFKEDLKKLHIKFPARFTRATEHIPEMVKLISALLKKKYAYIKEGSVYFDISRYKKYGELTHLDIQGLQAGARVDADEYAKDAVQDFVLWKHAKPGEPSWKAPFGSGRPGWHIECSAMSTKYLGQPFDIHAGAVDLVFPHHENEIAQSEAAAGKPFVRYWIHGEHLLVDGKKMAKSLGNVYTLRDIDKKMMSPLVFRYLVLTSHYRSKLNFTWKSLGAAQNSLERLYEFIRGLNNHRGSTLIVRDSASKKLNLVKKQFKEAIFDDLDTPKALAVIWGLVSDYHKDSAKYNPKALLHFFYDFDTVLGLGLKDIKSETIPAEIKKLAAKREQFRAQKKFAEADAIREKLKNLGWEISDTAAGQQIARARKLRPC